MNNQLDFFNESPNPHSETKAEIVSKYFYAWAKIMVQRARARRIIYLDLFSGPGAFGDGTFSTPLRVVISRPVRSIISASPARKTRQPRTVPFPIKAVSAAIPLRSLA